MKKYLYLAIAAVLLGLTACSKDAPINHDPIPENPIPGPNIDTEEQDYGSDNTTDPAVTGGRQDVFYLIDNDYPDNKGFMAVEIAGYLNLTPELKIAIGMAPDLNIHQFFIS